MKNVYVASCSGGKDSVYMIYYILKNIDKYPLDMVVHFELEIDYPFIKNVINDLEEKLKKYNIPLLRFKPRKNWIDLYNKYSYPSRVARWCNSKYKLDCKKQLKEYLNTKQLNPLTYIGICADEVKRIKSNGDIIYPLVDAGIKEKDILQWAKNQIIFNDYYKYNTRCGCMGCPMTSMPTWAYIRIFYPKEYDKIMELIKNSKYNPLRYTTEKLTEIIDNKYVPKIKNYQMTIYDYMEE